MIMRRMFALIMMFFALIGAAAAPASARTYTHGITTAFRDVTIGPDDVVNGDVTVFFGDVTVAGTVKGSINAIGGTVHQLAGATIDGDTNDVNGDYVRSIAPWLDPTTGMNAVFESDRRIMLKLAGSIIVLFVFLLFPLRVRVALERVEKHPGMSVAAGTIAMIAVVPIALLLIISIIGIPLIALEVAAIFACIWIGQGAIALLVGRRLYELIKPHATASPLIALILGLVVIAAAEIVPIVGWAVTALVWIVGLGCALLAFVGTPALEHYGSARAPISGPPMRKA